MIGQLKLKVARWTTGSHGSIASAVLSNALKRDLGAVLVALRAQQHCVAHKSGQTVLVNISASHVEHDLRHRLRVGGW